MNFFLAVSFFFFVCKRLVSLFPVSFNRLFHIGDGVSISWDVCELHFFAVDMDCVSLCVKAGAKDIYFLIFICSAVAAIKQKLFSTTDHVIDDTFLISGIAFIWRNVSLQWVWIEWSCNNFISNLSHSFPRQTWDSRTFSHTRSYTQESEILNIEVRSELIQLFRSIFHLFQRWQNGRIRRSSKLSQWKVYTIFQLASAIPIARPQTIK